MGAWTHQGLDTSPVSDKHKGQSRIVSSVGREPPGQPGAIHRPSVPHRPATYESVRQCQAYGVPAFSVEVNERPKRYCQQGQERSGQSRTSRILSQVQSIHLARIAFIAVSFFGGRPSSTNRPSFTSVDTVIYFPSQRLDNGIRGIATRDLGAGETENSPPIENGLVVLEAVVPKPREGPVTATSTTHPLSLNRQLLLFPSEIKGPLPRAMKYVFLHEPIYASFFEQFA